VGEAARAIRTRLRHRGLDSSGLLWAGDDRSADRLAVFLAELPQETSGGVQAVAMDKGPVYQAAVRRQLPNAMIVFDRFHVMKLNSGVIKMTEPIHGASAAAHQTPCGEKLLARRPDPDSININRSGSSTYPSRESVRITGTIPGEAFWV